MSERFIKVESKDMVENFVRKFGGYASEDYYDSINGLYKYYILMPEYSAPIIKETESYINLSNNAKLIISELDYLYRSDDNSCTTKIKVGDEYTAKSGISFIINQDLYDELYNYVRLAKGIKWAVYPTENGGYLEIIFDVGSGVHFDKEHKENIEFDLEAWDYTNRIDEYGESIYIKTE